MFSKFVAASILLPESMVWTTATDPLAKYVHMESLSEVTRLRLVLVTATRDRLPHAATVGTLARTTLGSQVSVSLQTNKNVNITSCGYILIFLILL